MLVYVCAHILIFFLFTGLIPVYRYPYPVCKNKTPSSIISLGWDRGCGAGLYTYIGPCVSIRT